MDYLTAILLLLAVISPAALWLAVSALRKKKALERRFSAIVDVEKESKQLKAEHEDFLKKSQEERTELEEQYRVAHSKYEELKGTIALLEENLEDISFGLYSPHYAFDTSEEYKAELKVVRDRQKQLIRTNDATATPGGLTIDGNRAEGKKLERQYTKVMLRAFNGESDAAVAKVSWNNVSKLEERVKKAYADINKLGATVKISITDAYLEEKLNEIRLTHEYEQKKYLEREEDREQRQQMREQEKAERELEKAKAEAEREETRNQKALDEARAEMDRATGAQLEKLTAQIAALESKLSEAHERKERAIARAQLTRSGFVYVISNEGSFGPDVVKIGMTRRIEPMDRVKELGDASVPFPFDLHAMMFSEDAPALEQALHDHFAERRVNLINTRKEFYQNVELGEVEKFIKTRGVTAQFVRIAEAREYRETQATREAKAHQSPLPSSLPASPFETAN